MITITRGNIFNAPHMALVNPVNCVGVSGAGLAKVFKERFPENFEAYRQTCLRKELRIGKVFVFETGGVQIINCPTKYHWRDNSTVEIVTAGLRAIAELSLPSLAIPALGCGLGGLEWPIVKPLMVRELALMNIPITIYQPHYT